MDIRDREKIISKIQEINPDYLFHLAAQPIVKESYADPVKTWETNTMGTINILEALKNLSKNCNAVLITSDKCYENLEWEYGYRENDKLGGIDPYSASKASTEIAISSYVRSYFTDDHPVKIGIGRAGNVIGGGDWSKDRIVPDCINSWQNKLSVHLRNPNSTRPWQHVLEPLSGYLTLAMELDINKKVHGEPFNFGPPTEQILSVGELVNRMSKIWFKDQFTNYIKEDFSSFHEAGLLKLNCDKSHSYLNWKSIWNINTTIEKTIEWYKNFYHEKNNENILNFTKSQIYEYYEKGRIELVSWTK